MKTTEKQARVMQKAEQDGHGRIYDSNYGQSQAKSRRGVSLSQERTLERAGPDLATVFENL